MCRVVGGVAPEGPRLLPTGEEVIEEDLPPCCARGFLAGGAVGVEDRLEGDGHEPHDQVNSGCDRQEGDICWPGAELWGDLGLRSAAGPERRLGTRKGSSQ